MRARPRRNEEYSERSGDRVAKKRERERLGADFGLNFGRICSEGLETISRYRCSIYCTVSLTEHSRVNL